MAGAIKKMLDPSSSSLHFLSMYWIADLRLDNFVEALENRCHFESINGVVLEKVCEYLYYAEKYKDSKDVPDMELPPELCLELLMAADFLNC